MPINREREKAGTLGSTLGSSRVIGQCLPTGTLVEDEITTLPRQSRSSVQVGDKFDIRARDARCACSERAF
jgi:hypothetical protein